MPQYPAVCNLLVYKQFPKLTFNDLPPHYRKSICPAAVLQQLLPLNKAKQNFLLLSCCFIRFHTHKSYVFKRYLIVARSYILVACLARNSQVRTPAVFITKYRVLASSKMTAPLWVIAPTSQVRTPAMFLLLSTGYWWVTKWTHPCES